MTVDVAAGLALAATLAVPVLSWIWARPQRGLLVLAALLPFDGLLLLVPAPTAVLAWKETLLLFTALAAFQPGHRAAVGRVTVATLPGWLLAMGLFVTSALVTLAWTPLFEGIVGIKVAFFAVLMGVVALRCPFEPKDRDRLVTVLAVTGFGAAAYGVVQQLLGPARLNGFGYPYNSVIRFSGPFMRSWGTFNTPFAFGFFLMLVILVCGSVALADTRRLRNQLVLIAMPLYLAGLVTAVVRTAWIGCAVGVCYLAVTRHRSLLRVWPVTAGILLIGLTLGFGAFFQSASATDRLNRWTQLPAQVAAAPLGHGVGSAGAAAAKAVGLSGGTSSFNPNRVGVDKIVFQPDDSYLEVLYEDGAAGLALFATALGAVLVAARRAERQQGRDSAFAGGVTALVIAAAVASVASTFFQIFPLDYMFWLLAGVVSTMGLPGRRPEPVRPPDLAALQPALA